METKDKKIYELTEEERKEKMQKFWRKAKPILKKVLFELFCILICLLLFFTLLKGAFSGNATPSSATLILK